MNNTMEVIDPSLERYYITAFAKGTFTHLLCLVLADVSNFYIQK